MEKKRKANEAVPGGGIRIAGAVTEEEKTGLFRRSSYQKMPGTTPCGFHCVELEHMSVRAGTADLLEDVSLRMYCGKLTVIIGKNGAGKSTLIKAILGEIPHEGTISFRDTKNNTVGNLKIGYVPQHLDLEKNAPVSVYDLVAGYTSRVPVFLTKSKRLYGQIRERLALFEGADLIDKRVGDLSGGELQRVLLTIACTPVPNLLILDEPVSGMDRMGRELFYRTLQELKNSYDMSVILVSHDLDLTEQYADRVVLLNKTVLKEGTAREVMESREFKNVFD